MSRRELLPCGEMCSNCPYDGGCHYPDGSPSQGARVPDVAAAAVCATQAREAQLYKLVAAGLTDVAIASQLGRDRSTVGRWRRRLGLAPNKALRIPAAKSTVRLRRRELLPDAVLMALWRSGMDDDKIAARVGCCYLTVGQHRRALQLPPNRKNARKPIDKPEGQKPSAPERSTCKRQANKKVVPRPAWLDGLPGLVADGLTDAQIAQRVARSRHTVQHQRLALGLASNRPTPPARSKSHIEAVREAQQVMFEPSQVVILPDILAAVERLWAERGVVRHGDI